MVRGERIKQYNFGNLTANADGALYTATSFPINGEILKLQWNAHNISANGSMYLQSNTPFNEDLGSVMTAQTDTVFYPEAHNNVSFPVVNDILHASGEGLGNGTSGNLVIYYR